MKPQLHFSKKNAGITTIGEQIMPLLNYNNDNYPYCDILIQV